MRTRRPALLLGLSALALAALARPGHAPLLIWNTTASAPLGLYSLHPQPRAARGELVAVLPPADLARDLAMRGVLPLGVPLIKPVAALAGQTVCRQGDIVTVDGSATAKARRHDRHGAPLPVWQGCRRLGPTEILLINPARDDSFDGRYFGPLPIAGVWGTVSPLWVVDGADATSVAPFSAP